MQEEIQKESEEICEVDWIKRVKTGSRKMGRYSKIYLQMRKGIWSGRGRPPNSTHSHADRKTLEYLARIV